MQLRAKNPLNRARWILLSLLFVVAQFGPLTTLAGTAHAASPVANPSLARACGLDIAIVIDNSTSISTNEMNSFKSALKAFTNALSGTPTQFSVTRFATSATVLQNFTSDVTTANNAIDSVSTGGGYTNWEDGLIKANSTFASGTSNPNLVIFATDGDPTTSNTVGGIDSGQPNAHLDPAIVAANTIKNGGTRMLAMGIGVSGGSLDRLKAISGPSANTGNVLTSDVITTDFAQLATSLATFASQTCGGTVTTTKYIDADGNANTTNDQTLAGAGWEFDVNGGSNPAASQTDAQGKTPAVKVDAASGYSVNETQKAGYTLLSASCTGAANNGSKNGNAVTGIQIASNNIVSCKFVNSATKGTLVVNKVVHNNHGGTKTPGNFSFVVNGQTYTFNGNGTNSIVLPTGTYTVDEVNPNTGGYQMTSNTCSNVVVSHNQTTNCTITNDDVTPKLIIKKHVVNDNGGTKVAGNFTMKVTGTNVSNTSFAGDEQGTTVTLNPGSYTVDETVDNEYVKSLGADCSGSIALGETKTCIVTNDDKAAGLTLVKSLIKDNGGTANATDWTLKATGTLALPTNLSGATGTAGATSGSNFKADTYTLSETGGPSGYTASAWTCTNGVTVVSSKITLTNGKTTVCTIVNDDDTPALTLVKKLGETYGSKVDPSNWTLTATGTGNNPTNLSGATGTAGATSGSNFKADTYTFGETGGPSGFTASQWSCVNNVTQQTTTISSALAIALGQSFTCTITNSGVQPKLTVIKHVENGKSGGTGEASDFTMYVDGTNVSDDEFDASETGTNLTLNVGEYEVSEGSHDGYNVTYSEDCEGTISLGDDKTCTVTNTAIAPTLTLKKKVINNNSGESSPSNWTLTATPSDDEDGADTISGNGEDGVVEETAVANVDYALSEQGPTGYAAGTWWCNDGEQDGNVITLALGENVTCYITNNDNQNPGLEVYKYGPDVAHEGDTVAYSFWVYNSGDTYIDNLSVVDDIAGTADCYGVTSLNPGDWVYCSVEYTIPAPQVANVENTVTSCGDYYGDRWNEGREYGYSEEEGMQVCATDTHTLDVLHPAIKVVKAGPTTAKVGDVVTYTFTVTNAGDEPLEGITVSDNIAGNGVYQSGDTNSDNKLDVAETWIYTAKYTVPVGSEGKQITNTVASCGFEPQLEESNPEISILKINTDAINVPKNDAIKVCATDTHTLNVEKPAELVNTGSGSAISASWFITAIMLGGVFIATRTRTVKK